MRHNSNPESAAAAARSQPALSAIHRRGTKVVVTLSKDQVPYLRYPATVVFDDGSRIVVRATWAEPAERDVGYVRFESGDEWTEHYWRDRWYAVKEVRTGAGRLKGWYCDVVRPVRIEDHILSSEDLDLDLWVAADLSTILRLDEDEFVASGILDRDPAAAAAAREALDELEAFARQGFPGLELGD